MTIITTSSILKASIMALLFLLSLTGNSLVVFIGWKNWNHTSQHSTHLLVFYLAVADVLEMLVAVPFEFIEELFNEWVGGNLTCKFIEYFQASALGASVFFITFIAIDRYLSVVRPLASKLKARHGKYIVGFCWLFPLIISTPYVAIYAIEDEPLARGVNVTVHICEPVGMPYDWMNKIYWAVETYFTLILPIIIMSFCYSRLVKKVLGMKKVGDPQPTLNASNSELENKQDSALWRMKIRSLRLALAFVSVFLICWTPKFVLQCIRLVKGARFIRRRSALYEVSLYMSYLNEVLNPVLYALIDPYFRQKLLYTIGWAKTSTTGTDTVTT